MNDDSLTWVKLDSESGPELPLFKVRYDTMRHPTRSLELKRMVLETPDWINVVAIAQDGKIVMVRQYRFGAGETTLEPVGGILDPGETPLEAARRELLEETGFGAGNWRYLGSVHANPAFHDNLCHHWLAEDVEFLQEPTPDEGEAIRTQLLTLEELRSAVNSGQVKHSLGLSALSRVFPLWELPHIVASPD